MWGACTPWPAGDGGRTGTEQEGAMLPGTPGSWRRFFSRPGLPSSPCLLGHTPPSGVPSADKAFNSLAFLRERVEGGARTRSKLPGGKRIVVLEFL